MTIITGKIEQCRDQPQNPLTKEEQERQIAKRLRDMKALAKTGYMVYPYQETKTYTITNERSRDNVQAG